MIILETQKLMMSWPVTITFVGWNVARDDVLSGQPRVENVQSADENQVSKTSSSWVSTVASSRLYFARAAVSLSATKIFPSAS